ncbi:MAG: HD domain-containing protein [Saprospiraceae bacterium]|nr:HD domain-containing protein [Saprospiraceae bacterium]
MIYAQLPFLQKSLEQFAAQQFQCDRSRALHFHNLEHSIQVVKATKKISQSIQLTPEESVILEIASWFQDMGYLRSFDDHERASRDIALEFMNRHQVAPRMMTRVCALIMSTRRTHNPQNIMEKILDDACHYHYASPLYWSMATKLRHEWQDRGITYTDEAWLTCLRTAFKEHRYHTEYGVKAMTPRKEITFTTYLEYLGSLN